MPRPWQRIAPWPYQLQATGPDGVRRGFMLRPGQNGEMVGRKTQRLDQVVPTTYDFVNSLPPYVERPFTLGPCPDGMGQKRQGAPDTRYRYAIDADLSIGGVARLGPALEGRVASGGGTIRGFAEGNHAGNTVLFALCADGVRRQTGETTWVLSDAAGLGAPVQAVRYRPSDLTAPDLLYVALDSGVLRYYDGGGAVWASAVLPAGITATAVERVRDELWIGGSNGISKATTNPRVAASWSAAIFVGDQTDTITRLRAARNQLFVVKQRGVYSVTTTTPFHEDLFPELRAFSNWGSAVNGQGIVAWRDALWFPFGGASYRLTPGDTAVLDRVGLSTLVENDTEVTGEQTAFAGDAFFGYYAYYVLATDTAYLVKHGTWINAGATGGPYVFNDVPHGALRRIVGPGGGAGQITAMYYTASFPNVSPRPRLYIGFASGDVAWITLPRGSPDPVADANCRFVPTGSVYYPDHDADAPTDAKHWRGFTAVGPVLSPTNYVTVDYATDQNPSLVTEPTPLVATGQRINSTGSLVTKKIQVRATLQSTSAGTPQLASLVLHEQVRPALALEHEVTVPAVEPLARLDGAVERRSADQLREALQDLAGPGPVVVDLPDGSRRTVDFVDYAEALAPRRARYGVGWDVTLRLVEFRREDAGTYVDAGSLALMMPFAPAQSR